MAHLFEELQGAPEDLTERREGSAASGASSLEDDSTVEAHPAAELIHQTRFAHARGASDEHQPLAVA